MCASEQTHAAHRAEPEMSNLVVVTIGSEEKDSNLIFATESSELSEWSFAWVLIKKEWLKFSVMNR